MPDRVDAAVEGDQVAGSRSAIDHRGGEAGCQQLSPSHHAVLPSGEASNHAVFVRNVNLTSLTDVRFTLLGRERRHPASLPNALWKRARCS